ncbi:MAG: hypothetical protein BWY21_01630 [Parcubacteria group bacterium ADurb.Bin216]|nr:MAG: hypothetical protein BWY21_01630 [Parcubacteria group bacterium ADurb.Bin216]
MAPSEGAIPYQIIRLLSGTAEAEVRAGARRKVDQIRCEEP